MRPVRTAARALLGAIFVVSGARARGQPASRYVPKAKRVTDRVAPLLREGRPAAADRGAHARPGQRCGAARRRAAARDRPLHPAGGRGAGRHLVPDHGRRAPVLGRQAIRPSAGGHEVHFMKNLGLLGGLLLAAADTRASPGLAWRAGHAVDHASTAASRGQRSLQRTARTARREARLADAGGRRPGATCRADLRRGTAVRRESPELHQQRVNAVEMSRTSVGSDTVA